MKISRSYIVLILVLLFSSCIEKQTIPAKVRTGGEGMEDSPITRRAWERSRLSDPVTGRIPLFIRDKELAFAATLPNDAAATNSKMTASWDFRGPWNVGGRTRAFAIDVDDENILLAGGVSAGMWRSTDGGDNWTRVSPVSGYPGVNAIAQDTRPGQTDTWYYLSGEAYGTSASGGAAFYLGNGMYKSTNNGITWTSLASTVSATPQVFDNVWDVTWNVVTDPGNLSQDVVYAACYDAVYRSVNGGTSWNLVRGAAGSSATRCYFTDVAVTPTSVVYATLSSDGTGKGIWRSPDGITYTDILPPNFPTVYDRQVIAIDPNNESTVYFFGPTPGFGKMSTDFQGDTLWNSLWRYEYISGNGSGSGGSWTDLSQNLPGNIGVFNGMNTQGGYDVVLKIKPGDPNVMFLGGTNLYRSTNAFADSLNTTIIGGYAIGASLPFVDIYPNHHPDQHVLFFLPSDPDVLFSAHDGGVSKTMDNMAPGVIWESKNDGYITSQFYTIGLDKSNVNDIIIGGLQDNGTFYTNSSNSLDPWYWSFDGDGSYLSIADGGNTYYMSKQQGRMLKATLNASGAITAYRRFDPIGGMNYRFINPYVVDPNDNNIMYLAAGRHVWRNDALNSIALTNQYDSISTGWFRFTDSITVANEYITAIAASKTPANRVYYGTDRKKLFRVDNANTGSPSAVNITYSLFPNNAYTSCIAINPNNADEVIVVFSNYSLYSIFHSTDGGTNWNRVAGNLEQLSTGGGNGPSCRWVSILPVSDGTVYLVGTSTGLYATDTLIHNGTVWVQQGATTIGAAVVDMMDTREADGKVVVATHGNGVYSANITSVNDIVSVKDLSSVNINFDLFPNPVKDHLTIRLPENLAKQIQTISIHNELGQQIRKVKLSAGLKSHEVSVSDLPKGIYYIRFYNQKIMSKSFVKM
jgi:hypothetical protein